VIYGNVHPVDARRAFLDGVARLKKHQRAQEMPFPRSEPRFLGIVVTFCACAGSGIMARHADDLPDAEGVGEAWQTIQRRVSDSCSCRRLLQASVI